MNDYLKPVNGKNENSHTLFMSFLTILFSWMIIAVLFALIPLTIFRLNPTPWQINVTELSQFIPIFSAFIVVSLYLKRKLLTFITSRGRFSWRNFFIGFVSWGGLLVAGTLISFIVNPASLEFSFDPATFYPALLALLIFVPLQVTSEELMFRGLVPQSLSRTSLSPHLVTLFSTLIFAAPHLINPEAQDNKFWALLAYSSMGFGWLVAAKRFGGSEISIGAHFVNNIFGLAIVGYEDSVIKSSSIWITPPANMFASAIALWLTVSIWLLILNKVKPTN